MINIFLYNNKIVISILDTRNPFLFLFFHKILKYPKLNLDLDIAFYCNLIIKETIDEYTIISYLILKLFYLVARSRFCLGLEIFNETKIQ